MAATLPPAGPGQRRRRTDHARPVQPSEQTGRYHAHKVADRFDQALLIEYVGRYLSLRPFDADFYGPDQRGVIVEAPHPPLGDC